MALINELKRASKALTRIRLSYMVGYWWEWNISKFWFSGFRILHLNPADREFLVQTLGNILNEFCPNVNHLIEKNNKSNKLF